MKVSNRIGGASRQGARPARTLRWAFAGAVLGLLAGLLVFAPAAWLAQAVSAATQGRLQLVDTRGGVWQGNAQLLLTAGAGTTDATLLPGRVEWSLLPAWDGLSLRLRAACCAPEPLQLRIAGVWTGMRLEVADGTSRWPAAVLAGLGAPWNTVRPEGALQLQVHHLSVEWFEGQPRMQGNLQLSALGMSSSLSTLRPVGSYRLQLEGQGATLAPQLRLETLEGSLGLQGNGQWSAAGWRFQGEASAAPGSEEALSNLLNIVGRRQGAKSIISLG